MDRIVDYISPAAFEDEMNKLTKDGFDKDKAIELMLDVLESNGYSAGVNSYKESASHCGTDFCDI